jgi:transposase InsO family protein
VLRIAKSAKRYKLHENQDHPNQVWLADITYLWTAEGWLYTRCVLDPVT